MSAKNDHIIKLLLEDPDIRIQANGTLEKLIHYRDLKLTKGQKKPVWRSVGFISSAGPKVYYYLYKNLQLKRIVWIRFFGPLRPDQLVICLDKNEANCAPENLAISGESAVKLKSYLDGRPASNSKVSWSQATAIRSDYKTGKYTQKKLAEKYEISQMAVSKIVNLETYKNKNNHEEGAA